MCAYFGLKQCRSSSRLAAVVYLKFLHVRRQPVGNFADLSPVKKLHVLLAYCGSTQGRSVNKQWLDSTGDVHCVIHYNACLYPTFFWAHLFARKYGPRLTERDAGGGRGSLRASKSRFRKRSAKRSPTNPSRVM